MNSTHTQGQWRIGDAGLTVFGPPNGKPAPEIIATCKTRANAAYIVHAANLYPELVEALTECLAWAELDDSGNSYKTLLEATHALTAIRLEVRAILRKCGEISEYPSCIKRKAQ